MTKIRRVLLPLALLSLAMPASAQIRASELATMSQTIDGTKVTIQYSRPRARGRNPLFGTRVVHWDEVWTPGANWATTLDVTKDVTLDGHRVPKGTYSVWMVVRKSGDWTFVLDTNPKVFHMDPPDSAKSQIRFPVRATAVPLTDVLTWSMPALRIDGGTLAMDWGTTRIAVQLSVTPSLVMTLPAADAQAYLGRYEYVETEKGKTTTKAFIVTYENGTLKGRYDPNDNYMKTFALIRIAPDWFAPGIYDETGQIYEVLRPDMTFEFARQNGKVTSFAVRDDEDKQFATGTRKP